MRILESFPPGLVSSLETLDAHRICLGLLPNAQSRSGSEASVLPVCPSEGISAEFCQDVLSFIPDVCIVSEEDAETIFSVPSR